MKVVPVSVRPGNVNGVRSLNSYAATISKAFPDPIIMEFNTKLQVKVMSDPTTTASLLAVSVREDEVGTTNIQAYNIMSLTILIILIYSL